MIKLNLFLIEFNLIVKFIEFCVGYYINEIVFSIGAIETKMFSFKIGFNTHIPSIVFLSFH